MPTTKSLKKPLETEYHERETAILNLKKDIQNENFTNEEKEKQIILFAEKKESFDNFKFRILYFLTADKKGRGKFLHRWQKVHGKEFIPIPLTKEINTFNEIHQFINWIIEKPNSPSQKNQQNQIWEFLWKWFKDNPKLQHSVRKNLFQFSQKKHVLQQEKQGLEKKKEEKESKLEKHKEEEETKEEEEENESIDSDENEDENLSSSDLDEEDILKQTKAIYGITYLHILYSKEFNQLIYLFGEDHLKYSKKECEESKSLLHAEQQQTYIVTYIESLLQYFVTSFFDFYLERPLLLEEKQLKPLRLKYESRNINNLQKLFKGCLEILPEEECEFKNIRVHAVNARIRKESSTIVQYLKAIQLLIPIYEICVGDYPDCSVEEKDIESKMGTNWQEVLHPVKKLPTGKYNKSDINQLFEIDMKSKVEKEINLIDKTKFNLDNKKIIKNMLLDELLQVRQILYKTYEITQQVISDVENYILGIEKFDLESVKDNFESLKGIEDYIKNNSSKIMDIYTLARIFHKFESKPNQIRRHTPAYATNIIYYAGDIHSKYTQSLLIRLGFKEIYAQENKNDKACIFAPSLTLLEKYMLV